MKVTFCDCCERRPAARVFVMDHRGIHPPTAVQRQDGFSPVSTVDLCESCSTSLIFHWNENARGEVKP